MSTSTNHPDQSRRKGRKIRQFIASKLGRGAPLTADKFLEGFKACDKNGNRKLDGKEIDKFLLEFVLSAFGDKSGNAPNSEDLQTLKNDFMEEFDTNKDGKITVGELAYILTPDEAFHLLFRLQNPPGKTVDYMKVWKKYDKSVTGFIEFEGLKLFLRDLITPNTKNKKIDEAELDAYTKDVMETFDANGDGKLRYSEFMRMMPGHENIVERVVTLFDDPRKLNSGYMQTILKNYDKDGTGCLEKEEITQLSRDILDVTKNGQYDAKDVDDFRNALLEGYDSNKNYRIDVRELKMILEEVMEVVAVRR